MFVCVCVNVMSELIERTKKGDILSSFSSTCMKLSYFISNKLPFYSNNDISKHRLIQLYILGKPCMSVMNNKQENLTNQREMIGSMRENF